MEVLWPGKETNAILITLTHLFLVPWSIVFSNISIDEMSREDQVEDSKESSQQLSPLTVAASVVGVCIFSALILFVLFLGVGLRVRYKRKHSRPMSSGEQGESHLQLMSSETICHDHCIYLHGCMVAG